MTTNIKEKINRLNELAKIPRQRYLENFGNPHLSVGSLNNNNCLNQEEREEFRNLFNQVVPDENIVNYQKENTILEGRITKGKY